MDETGRVKKPPKSIAVINADQCTGCEACRETCPVDCIHLVTRPPGVKGIHVWCEVDLERCIGCKLCVRLPRRKSNAYELKICPWDAIEMVPLEVLPQAVAHIGGPADYVATDQERLVAAAERLKSLRQQAPRATSE